MQEKISKYAKTSKSVLDQYAYKKYSKSFENISYVNVIKYRKIDELNLLMQLQ